MINFIFKAIFVIKAKADISLYSATLATDSYSFIKVALLESLGIHLNATKIPFCDFRHLGLVKVTLI